MINKFYRRYFLALIACAGITSAAMAQQSDGSPVKWVVGFPAGAATDFVARIVSEQVAARLNRPVIVDNKPGAGGGIAAQSVASAAPDGRTVLSVDNGMMVFNTALFKKLPYDPEKDFKTVGVYTKTAFLVLANSQSKYKTMKDVADDMRRDPGKVNYATPGMPTPHNLAMEMLKDKAKLQANPVHYKGGAPAIQDVVGGQMDLIVLDAISASAMVKAGKLRPLAVFSKQRLVNYPDTPTLIELGLSDQEVTVWGGMVVPSATPEPIRRTLADALRAAMNTESVRAKIRESGGDPVAMGPEEMEELWRADLRYWVPLIKSRGISVD